jgi:hypothetical protein
MPSFNKKLTELKNKMSEKNQKESEEETRWKKKYDKIINTAEQIFDTGYNGSLEFFIPNADILKFCKVELKQSRGSHLSFRIYRDSMGTQYWESGISTGPKTVYNYVFEEHMAFTGYSPVEFSSHTEYLLDYIEGQISNPDYIQELIDNV